MTAHQAKPEYEQIVAAIPHSVGELSGIYRWLTKKDPSAARDKWTDWFTDELFGIEMPCVTIVKALYSRLECDCERLEGEDDRLMHFVQLEDSPEPKYFHESSMVRRNELLAKWYEYRAKILHAASDRTSIIVDCHSFPSEVAPDVDICLGFNDDSSKPRDQTIESVAAIFRKAGYTVALNRPYANALAPTDYIGHSLMIEVNKKTYMDEVTLQKTDGFGKLRKVIEDVYRELLWMPYNLPRCFICAWPAYGLDWDEEAKRIAWEQVKREIVSFTAERYGLPMPQDLSDSPKLDAFRKGYKRDGHSHQLAYYWSYWNGLTRSMLKEVFGRVGIELQPGTFIRGWEDQFHRRFLTDDWYC